MKKILLAIVVFTLLLSTTANAEVFGGYWTSDVSYYISSSNPYYTPVTAAANSWNNVLVSISAPIEIRADDFRNSNVHVFTEYYGDVGWSARGEPGPNYNYGSYTYGTIYLNKTLMDGYGIGRCTSICVHEFGHILGLAHHMSSSPQCIMYVGGDAYVYLQWGLITPQPYDISVLDSIY